MPRDPERLLNALLDALEPLLDEAPERVLAQIARAAPWLREEPEVLYLEALARWRVTGPASARAALERTVARDPEHADARHALGDLLGELDDRAGMIAQWLEVSRLDALTDRARGLGRAEVRARITRVAEEVLAGLPEELRERLRNVPVVLEPRPSRALVEDGFDPRALGLFEGPDDFQQRSVEAPPQPARIVLFAANLEASFPDPAELEEEVEVTVLHELGHYFGLDEDGVERLGLE
ncbi:MAG: metallopeptidase family protein [Nannocystaceae bacterium]|nr:metallopeptidase family protein [Myxococcales bacterium]